VHHLLSGPAGEAVALAQAIEAACRSTQVCSQCFNLDAQDPCSICADPARDRSLLLVVEDARDLRAFDQSGWRGLYHVLRGRVSGIEGVGPADLTIEPLLRRVTAGGIREICLATNPDLEGEGTARLLGERLASSGATVTRIARGIPAGASIHQVAQSILADAIEGRRRLPQ
jgi:recombination protein RecR